MKKFIFLILLVFVGTLCWVSIGRAGFGISPPSIINNYLFPGSRFEETIYLVRGDPDKELRAEVTIDDSPIKSWITIVNGMTFPLPKGEKKVPMKVRIDVPQDAPYGKYKGIIRVRALSSERKEGQVTTVLGGAITLDLAVTEEIFSDFEVKIISVPEVEKGNPVVVLVNLENLGNTKTKPSKIHLDIYDLSHRKILRSADIFDIKGWIEPFQIGQVRAELPVNLDLGEYWADIFVYKNEKEVGRAEVHFRVIPPKEKPTVTPKPSFFTSRFLTAVVILVVVLILIIIVLSRIRKTKKKRERKE